MERLRGPRRRVAAVGIRGRGFARAVPSVIPIGPNVVVCNQRKLGIKLTDFRRAARVGVYCNLATMMSPATSFMSRVGLCDVPQVATAVS